MKLISKCHQLICAFASYSEGTNFRPQSKHQLTSYLKLCHNCFHIIWNFLFCDCHMICCCVVSATDRFIQWDKRNTFNYPSNILNYTSSMPRPYLVIQNCGYFCSLKSDITWNYGAYSNSTASFFYPENENWIVDVRFCPRKCEITVLLHHLMHFISSCSQMFCIHSI
jgi:hypothetical protein